MSSVAFHSKSTAEGNSTVASAANPPSIAAGDFLLVFLNIATGGTGSTQPSTPNPTGYTLLGTRSSQTASNGDIGAWYFRWATGSDTPPSVAMHSTQPFKWSMTVTAHSGGAGTGVPEFVSDIDPQSSGTAHKSSTLTTAKTSHVLETFGIKSTTNGSYTTPAGTINRAQVFGTGGGAADAVVFESTGDVTGTVGGHTTSSDTASTYGVHATIVIPPGGVSTIGAGASISLTGGSTATVTVAPANTFAWGISNNDLANVEAALGHPVPILRDYGWFGKFDPNWQTLARQRQMFLSCKFRTNSQTTVPAVDVSGGNHDADLVSFITQFMALPANPFGLPHVLIFEHECDAASGQASGTIAQLTTAIRYCWNAARGTPGWNGLIGFVLTGFSITTRGPQWPSFMADPSSGGADIQIWDNPYNNGFTGLTPQTSFASLGGPICDWYTANTTVPLYIGEWGSVPSGSGSPAGRANWLKASGAELTKPRYNRVAGVMYWNNGGYALSGTDIGAWVSAGNEIAATVEIDITGAATTALKVPETAAAAVNMTAGVSVTSSTGASLPAALMNITAATAPALSDFGSTGVSLINVTGMVSAPVAGTPTAEADLFIFAQVVDSIAASINPAVTGAVITISASAIGPPKGSAGAPVAMRARIVDAATTLEYDISTMLGNCEIVLGRGSALDTTVPAGTATLTLDDSNGTFDPDNTKSPLYGYLSPRGPATLYLDVFVPFLGRYVDLGTYGLESLERTFTGGLLSTTTGVWVDQTDDLSRHIPAAGTTFPAQLPGDRIRALLATPSRTGFLWQSRAVTVATQLDTGQKMLAPLICDGTTSSYDYAVQAATAEGGVLFFNPSGTLVFSGQQDRLTQTPVWQLGDDPTAQTPVEDDLTFRTSSDDMVIDVAVTIGDGTYMYGPNGPTYVPAGVTFNADAQETSALASWTDAASRAQHVYASRSVARRNAPVLTLEGAPTVNQWTNSHGVPTAWQAAIMTAVADLATVTRHPADGGTTIVANCWVEGKRLVINATQFTATLNVSRADPIPAGGYWTLGVSSLAVDTNLTW